MGLFYGHNQDSISPAGLGNGYLYNGYAAFDVNFAPTDWRVALIADFQDLDSYMSTEGFGSKEDGLIHWDSPNNNGTGVTGLNAYGSGLRMTNGTFTDIMISTAYWAYFDGITPLYYALTTNSASFLSDFTVNEFGYSVRLVYTGGGSPSTVTDNDGNIYDTVLIDGVIWTAQNWKCTTLEDGNVIPTVTNNATWAGLSTLAKCAYDNDESNV